MNKPAPLSPLEHKRFLATIYARKYQHISSAFQRIFIKSQYFQLTEEECDGVIRRARKLKGKGLALTDEQRASIRAKQLRYQREF